MSLKEDLPTDTDDFVVDWLTVSEWQALVDYHEREVWVWDKVADHEVKSGDRKGARRYKEVADWHRNRARVYKGYTAQEELAQTKFEAEQEKRRKK